MPPPNEKILDTVSLIKWEIANYLENCSNWTINSPIGTNLTLYYNHVTIKVPFEVLQEQNYSGGNKNSQQEGF